MSAVAQLPQPRNECAPATETVAGAFALGVLEVELEIVYLLAVLVEPNERSAGDTLRDGLVPSVLAVGELHEAELPLKPA